MGEAKMKIDDFKKALNDNDRFRILQEKVAEQEDKIAELSIIVKKLYNKYQEEME